MGNTHGLCGGELAFEESGKRVQLSLKPGEQAKAIVLDGCVFKDNDLRCDGLFLWRGRTKKAAILIELKGARDIPHAFKQLAYVRKYRPEYRQLIAGLADEPGGRIAEKAMVVSNGLLNKPDHERLEREHGIRVTAIHHSKPSTPVPNVRDYL